MKKLKLVIQLPFFEIAIKKFSILFWIFIILNAWVNAQSHIPIASTSSYPGQISNGCDNPLVTIQTGHQMVIQTGSTIDIPNLKIEGTAKLTIKSGGKIYVQDQLQLDQNAAGAIIIV